jgi:hypothetical protein
MRSSSRSYPSVGSPGLRLRPGRCTTSSRAEDKGAPPSARVQVRRLASPRLPNIRARDPGERR